MTSFDDEEYSQHWRVDYLVASIGISFLGTYTTTTLSEQYRVSRKMKNMKKSYLYLVAMAFSTGGVAIWSMHFVGMGALTLKNNSKGEIMNQYFDVILTVLSLMSSLIAVFLGNYIASFDNFYRKEPHEIFALIVDRGTQRLSLGNMQNPHVLWALTLFSDLQLILLGGVITGFGVCLMHYVGMMSMTMNMAITWDASLVVASIIVACVASIAANWILFRLLALHPKREFLRILSAFLMSVAVCGMHYTGMMAATYHPLHTSLAGSRHWNLPLIANGYLHSEEAIFIALTFGLSGSWFMVMVTLADLRTWHYSLAQNLNESRKMVMSMSRGSRLDEDRLLRQSIDLGAQYDRLNEGKLPYRMKSRPPSMNLDCGPKVDHRPSCDQGDHEAPDGQRRPHPPPHHHHHHPSQVHPAPSSSLQMLPAQEDEEHERELALCKKSVPRLSPSSGTDRERGSVEISGKTAQTDFDLGCNEISLHSKRKSSRRISRITPADGQEVEAQEEKGGEPPGEPLTGNEEIV
jgi:NO-binding membrane sensor protein with MHYT domain